MLGLSATLIYFLSTPLDILILTLAGFGMAGFAVYLMTVRFKSAKSKRHRRDDVGY